MRVSTLHHGQRGETIVALLRVEISEQEPPTFVLFIRLGHRDGRTEQWAQVSSDPNDATERYARALEDFITPIPFLPSEPSAVSS